MKTSGPLVLVVLDGWGLREERAGNAIKLARTPSYLELLDRYANSSLQASSEYVGLPLGQMGNSEVGHITMGAGRVVYQDLTRIDKSVSDGDFLEKPALVEAMTRCHNDAHALHLVGLVSPNGIHSHTRHLYALIEMAARHKLQRVFVQGFTDGRDTSPAGGARVSSASSNSSWLGSEPAESHRSAAATTEWIATTAGSARGKRTTRW